MGGRPAIFAGFKVTRYALAEYAHAHNLEGTESAVLKSLSKKIGVRLIIVQIDYGGMDGMDDSDAARLLDDDEYAADQDTVWLCAYAEGNLQDVRDLDMIVKTPLPEAFVKRIPELIETVDGRPRRMVAGIADVFGRIPVGDHLDDLFFY